jgi:carboxypeptidase C (cathepsin A)
LARFTGLDQEVLARHQNRVSFSLFTDEYQKRNDRLVSRYDGAISVPGPKPADEAPFDPILDGTVSVLTPAMVQYAAEELGFRTDLPYLLLNRNISQIWDRSGNNRDAGALDDLEEARTQNPALRVLIVHGYTDLVTTYSASRYLMVQLRPIEGAEPVKLKVYRGGHMMYMRPASRRQLQDDARELYRSVIAPAPR